MKKFRFLLSICIIILFLNCSCCSLAVSSTKKANNKVVPSINSRSAIVIERTTHIILYGKNENQKRKMASTTKIMTAIVVLENANLTDTVTISKKSAGTGGSRLGLKTSDKVTVKDLLYGLLLCSGNDAAVALAEYVGGDVEGFAKLMNSKAHLLGLDNTNFVTPHGLDNDEHYTTAYELAILTDYALKNSTFKSIVSTHTYTVNINGNPKSLHNTNELLDSLNGIYGVKTGFTNGANRCLVSAVKRGNLDIICVVLSADSKKFRGQDSVALVEYVYDNFKMINIKDIIEKKFEQWKIDNLCNFTIDKAKNTDISISLLEFPYELIPINKKDVQNINIDISCDFDLIAPVIENKTVGTLVASIDGKSILSLDIFNNVTIEKKDILFYFKDFFVTYLNSLFEY